MVTSRAEEEIAPNMTAGTATNFLRQTALVLEERSRSLATKNARLRDHFDASLVEIEAAITSNKTVRAETDAAVTNPDTSRESLGNTYQVTAAEVRAAALAAKARAGRRASTASLGAGQAAAAVGGQEIRRAAGALALLKQDAQEEPPEADQRQLAEERDAWAVWSGEWGGEAGSFVSDFEVSGVQEGLVADRWKASEEAAVVVRGREAELRNGLGVAQAAILALRSATGETARCSEAALDDMRDALATAQSEIGKMKRDRDAALQSLLEVAHIRRTPGRLLRHQPATSEGKEQEEDGCSSYAGGAGSGSGRGDDIRESFSRWDSYPEHSAARPDNEESQARGLTRLTGDEEEEEEGRVTFGDSSNCVRTPVAAALKVFEGIRRLPGTAEPAAAVGTTRDDDQAEAGGVDDYHTNTGGGESSGEHVCGVCGTSAPSFRKLFDCRLSLRRAQAEAAEARAWALELEERTTTAVEDLVEENLAETVRKLESTFDVTREGLERRLTAAEARGQEMGEKTAVAQREVAELVEAAATREGEIAVLRTRLRAAEEDVGSARREALLEGSARSLAETEAAGRKAAQAWAGAVALKNKCRQQEQTIAGLALSRGEEADACRAARDELEKERSSRVESEGHVRELQGEVSRLASLLGAANDEIERQRNISRDNEIGDHRRGQSGRGGGEAGGEALDRSASTQGVDDTDVCRYDGDETPTRRENQTRHHHTMSGRIEHGITPESWRGSCDNDKHVAQRRQCDRVASTCSTPVASFTDRVGTREAKERERARKTLLALEESLRAGREEVRHHKRRAERLRAALREAQERGEEAEAAGSSARVAAEAAGAAAGLAREETDAATAGKRKAEEDTASAARRHREEVEAIEAEVLRATAAALGAREQCSVAQREASGLRETVRELDRRVILLEQQLGASIASLHAADARRVCALVGRIRDLGGREWEGEARLEDLRARYEANNGAVGGRMLSDPAVSGPGKAAQDLQEAARTGMRLNAVGNGDNRSGESERLQGKSLRNNSASAFEVTTLRDRLAASQAQHVELVRASEAAVAGCNQRCDAHIRVVLAAGKLTAACLLRRGVVAGREATVEAAGRLELARRCFRALREEALRASRDRSVRRQERLQRWIGEAFEGAGEEVESMATRKRCQQPRQQQHQPHLNAGVVVGQGYFRSSSDGCLSWEASQPLVLG
ncbi:hypothetical protein Esi_0282_0025 [Ectocarpus siliculosus]|uniref:Uncharacterized protein n=1 Tax=Ectocarpus siliculosus TaxID=2880 RepID=D7FUY9_ECTSI|nr:hypothetical protein Esi_0282_0025 [Ectocarpus siliculosus]|eukprot:CBJ31795.1 hypothetical protein Esi_0282_0025 [Ectocarpus siliculosus]